MKIGEDKIYTYYHLFKQELIVEETYASYQWNKNHCRRKNIVLSDEKLKMIHDLFDQGRSLDAILGHDKLINHMKRVSTKTLY